MRLTETGFELRLPDWLPDELAGVPDTLPDPAARLALVNRLARRNFHEGNGGPFAALVVESQTGRIVSAGVNMVLGSDISLAHAEVMAIGVAQRNLGVWDLGGAGLPAHELIVNWRTCIQCYGAALWSGIRTLTLAGDGPELERITGFDEGPMREDWQQQFAERGIAVRIDDGAARAEAIAVFEEYRDFAAATGAVVYNARSGD